MLRNLDQWDVEDLATLLYGAAMGWKPEETIQEEEIIEEEGAPDSDPLDELFFREFHQLDKEVEREVIVTRARLVPDEHGFPTREEYQEKLIFDGASVDQPYFTRSGDNPVTEDYVTKVSREISAAGFLPEEIQDLPDQDAPDYLTWKYSAQSAKRRERRFHQWVRFIHNNKEDRDRLRAGWRKFWAIWYKYVAIRSTSLFLTKKQKDTITEFFNRHGIWAKAHCFQPQLKG